MEAQQHLHIQMMTRDPFRNFLVKAFVGLFCFGIPYLYVPKEASGSRPRTHADGYRELEEVEASGPDDKQTGLLADSAIFAASVALVVRDCYSREYNFTEGWC